MRLRTTLHLASFFPIFISAIFVAYLFTVHLTIVMPNGGRPDIPTTGAIAMAIFALVVGWCFYRAGLRLVRQVGVLEHMTDRVQRGDLSSTTRVPAGKGEVATIANVFKQMVAELRGYVELIGAHEKLKKEYDAAQAMAEQLRESAVDVSGVLELLERAEQGIITRLLNEEQFLLAWLPRNTLSSSLGAPGLPSSDTVMSPIPPDVRAVFHKLAGGGAADTRPPGTVSLLEAIQDAVLLCRWKWERERPQAPVTVKIDAAHAESVDVLAGYLDMMQALTALLANAAEAMSDSGTVSVELRTDADGTRSVAISDNGRGMSTSVRSRCMKPFFSTKEGSLGIGLNLAGRLATRHGGRLGIISEKDKGTTAYLTFPKPPKPGDAGTSARLLHGPLKVLLVDDDEASRETLLAMLAKQGHQATGAADGAAAVLLLRKQRFDVVMTDLAMPIMTGGELAIAVKTRHPGTPVVLVSGAGEELERRHMLPDGVDVILPKPVLSFDLALALSRAMERAASAAALAAKTTA